MFFVASNITGISCSQIRSLNQFIKKLCQSETEINCDIDQLNSTIDDLLKFDSNVTKCLKSYLCKYIEHISNHYCSCYNSLKENITTFEEIQKCVKTMLSQLNGGVSSGGSNGKNGESSKRKRRGAEVSSGSAVGSFSTEDLSKQYVNGVFSNILDDKINITICVIKENCPSKKISKINEQLKKLNCTGVSNDIAKTIRELGCLKCLLSGFIRYIRNYSNSVRGYLFKPLSTLKTYESHIYKIKNPNGISSKYECIKHKVNWCESSLKFEVKRLNSIKSNAKVLKNQLESIIKIFEKYKKNEENLKKLKQKLNELKQNKKDSILKLTQRTKSIICNLGRIENISNCLKGRKDSVSIMTIKSDIEYIKSEIESIDSIVSSVQSTLNLLVNVDFQVNCQTVNEIEGCIKEIVCLIHKKYCSLSSIPTINIPELCKTLTSGENCDLTKISACACPQPSAQSPDSCKVCGTIPGREECQCCLQICKCLDELKSKATSCKQKIDENLACIKSLTNKLTYDKTSDGCQTTSGTCETVQPQAAITCQQSQPKTGCNSQSDGTAKLIQCLIDELKKWQSNATTCESTQVSQCENPPASSCQATENSKSTTECSKSGQQANSCNLAEVKLCLDKKINKCCCQYLKQFIDQKNIETCINLFKLVIIFNFGELFCLYLGFDKWMVEYFSSCMNKLGDMKLYMRGIGCIQNEINSRIGYIKYEINQMPEEIRILENHMKLAITEMECEIEEVPRNMIRCSLKSLSNWIKNWYNSNQGLTKIIC